jgi:hypothetical protein
MACTKDRTMYQESNYSAVNSQVSAFQALTDFTGLAHLCMTNTNANDSVYNIVFAKTSLGDSISLHMHFGDTTDVDQDGRRRGGDIFLIYPSHFPQTGDQFPVQFNHFLVNGVEYNGSCLFQFDAHFASRNHYRILTTELNQISFGKPFSLRAHMGVSTSGAYGDAYTTGTLASELGFLYQSNIIDSIYLNANVHCFEKGKCILKADAFQAQINYGDGREDQLATATSDLFRYIIELKSF